ncbi:MAG: CoB--CoM heterodisulfide reductase iron-sulfur subunit B family protein [Psychrilyobacter sp.]|nr:CoB--CoM heterodisulfide reductase iron-sulfur subunit B family protein [Psychrilyobacter sp.]
MKYSYYPGCTLKTKGKEFEKFALDSAKKLEIEIEEQENWQCCGAVYPMAENEIAPKLSAVRSLAAAKEKQEKLITLCSACHHVIKRVNKDIKTKPAIRKKVNDYLELDNNYNGDSEVIHYLEMLRDDFTFKKLASKVTNPLKGRKIGAYYGCLLLRPGKDMNFDNAENPSIIENFIEAIGGEAIKYPYRTECCGGYLITDNETLVDEMTSNIIKSAKLNGIKEIVTACPLCKYNLETSKEAQDGQITSVYFTELLAEALDVK